MTGSPLLFLGSALAFFIAWPRRRSRRPRHDGGDNDTGVGLSWSSDGSDTSITCGHHHGGGSDGGSHHGGDDGGGSDGGDSGGDGGGGD